MSHTTAYPPQECAAGPGVLALPPSAGSGEESSEFVPNRCGSDPDLCQLVNWDPCGLQVRFQADQGSPWVNDDEHDVEFVVWAILVVVEVLGERDGIATNSYLCANLFTKFARKRVGRTFPGLNVSARQEPPVLALSPHKQDARPTPDHRPRDHLDRGRSHRDRPYVGLDAPSRLWTSRCDEPFLVPTAVDAARFKPPTRSPRRLPRSGQTSPASIRRESTVSLQPRSGGHGSLPGARPTSAGTNVGWPIGCPERAKIRFSSHPAKPGQCSRLLTTTACISSSARPPRTVRTPPRCPRRSPSPAPGTAG